MELKLQTVKIISVFFSILIGNVFFGPGIAAGCVNECPPNGPRQCFGDGYRSCGEMDSDGCLEWSQEVNCPAGWYCADGICVAQVMHSSSQEPPHAAVSSSANPSPSGQPPVISQLSQPGNVTSGRVTIACATDRIATCRFDTSDVPYDSMVNSMSSDYGRMAHFGRAILAKEGKYVIYIRCADGAGFKNKKSAEISFIYTTASGAVAGPSISSFGPAGNIYQKNIALTVITDNPANCRYSHANRDYSAMEGEFVADDDFFHRKMVILSDYGDYEYYVRCRDKSGNVNADAAIIFFNYVEPAQDGSADSGVGAVTSSLAASPAAEITAEISCRNYVNETEDGVCDNTKNCLCDRDCPVSADPNADPDCVNVAPETETASAKVPVPETTAPAGPAGYELPKFLTSPADAAVAGVIGGIILAAVVGLILAMKRRDEADIES